MKQDNRGMTLVESVCGLLILTMVLVTMYSAFLFAQKILAEGDAREEQNQQAFADLALNPGREISANVTLPLGEGSITLAGTYQSAGDSEEKTELYHFETIGGKQP